MMTVTLDTLKVAKRLREAGFSEIQAESVTNAIPDGVGSQDLATKTQLDAGLGALKS